MTSSRARWPAGPRRPGPARPRRAEPAGRRSGSPAAAARCRAACARVRARRASGRRTGARRGRGSQGCPAAPPCWSASRWRRRSARSRGPAGREWCPAAAAISSRTVHSSRTAARARRPLALWMPDVRRHGSCRGGGTWSIRCWNSCAAHSALPDSSSSRRDHLAQLEQHLDVEGGVLQPRLGQRPLGPVDRGVLLAHRLAHDHLDQRGQADARVAEQAGGELGVEEPGRAPARPRAGTGCPGWRRAGSTRRRRSPRRGRSGRRRRSGRPARCRSPRGAAGSGRRAGSSGSPRPARRRGRSARCRRRPGRPRRRAGPRSR